MKIVLFTDEPNQEPCKETVEADINEVTVTDINTLIKDVNKFCLSLELCNGIQNFTTQG